MAGTFRSLKVRNYRLWAMGALISNVGTWMQRTTQDWLVLTVLTPHNATAVGIVTGLQFGPQLVLLPWTGYAADHFDRRYLLLATQIALGLLALSLGLLTVFGHIQLWHVYTLALLMGCVTAFDGPANQTFVSELVGETEISNAVALNSISFHSSRLIGPALAGILISAIGTGWVFMLNAASYLAVIGVILLLRVNDLHREQRITQKKGSFVEGLHYVAGRPDLRIILMMLFLIGTFTLNFPIFISTMSVDVFHVGAAQYGLLSSVMAIGAVAGALLAARAENPNLKTLITGTLIMGMGYLLAAMATGYWLFAALLVIIGVASQTFTTNARSLAQLSTPSAMRGRVMALFLAITLGGMPLGAPLVGWVADAFGPRWSLAVAGLAGILASAIAIFQTKRPKSI